MTEAPARNVAIVTGGTRGIGRAISTRLARDGWDLLATYHHDNDAAAVAQEELRAFGGRVEILAADISKPDGAGETIETAIQAFGKIDALVNNAGITRDTLIMRMSEDDWDAVLSTNLKGAFLTSKAVIRPIQDAESAYYLNVEVLDRPGVLAQVAGVFGDHSVSIRSMEQEGLGGEARLIFITHRAREADVQATLAALRQLEAVDRIGSVLRVIGDD